MRFFHALTTVYLSIKMAKSFRSSSYSAMSPFTTVLLVACAALLVGTDARQHGHRTRSHSHLRNSNDATVALGKLQRKKKDNHRGTLESKLF